MSFLMLNKSKVILCILAEFSSESVLHLKLCGSVASRLYFFILLNVTEKSHPSVSDVFCLLRVCLANKSLLDSF